MGNQFSDFERDFGSPYEWNRKRRQEEAEKEIIWTVPDTIPENWAQD